MRYTLLRLAVLAVVGALLLAVGLRGLLWAVVTVLVAAAVSYLLLSGPRAQVLARLEAGRRGSGAPGRGRRGRTSDESVEDAAADAVDRPGAGPAPGDRPV